MKEIITIQISKFLTSELVEQIAQSQWKALTPQFTNRSRQYIFDELVNSNDCFGVIATTAKNQGNKNVNDSNKDVSKSKNENVAKYQHWQYAFEEVAGLNPDFKQITVADQSAQVTFSKWGNQRASDTYRWDPASGAITSVEYYRDADNSGKIRGWIYSIHVGNWGGWLTRILWFLASLLGASLPLTGYYLWIRRTYKQPNSARTT